MDEIPVLKRVNDDLILTKKPTMLTDPDIQNCLANRKQLLEKGTFKLTHNDI